MDPALEELLQEGAPEDEVAVILRLRNVGDQPPHARIVARFGDIVTARVRRRAVRDLWVDPTTVSVKAPRLYTADIESADAEAEPQSPRDSIRPGDLTATGRGVVIGIADWGCDVAHSDFRHRDGRTRLLALWDQRPTPGDHGQPYGYGRILTAAHINAALEQPDPYAALGYHPADFDAGTGTHGTHTLSIAAGNGRGGGPVGMAPEADCVFVNLGRQDPGGVAPPLGNSVELLEAIDFIRRMAGDRPFVINLSLGRHAGEHTGHTLVEMAMDHLVSAAPGRAIVQSVGNYYERRTHASWLMRPGDVRRFTIEIDPTDRSANELDIWYPGRDRLTIEISSPDSAIQRRVALGQQMSIVIDGREVARARHRRYDPNNGDHQCSIFLEPGHPTRRWELALFAEDVVDGRVHAWIERDSGCRTCQSRFLAANADPLTSVGTIANGYYTVVVGAHSAHDPGRPVARFSSCGPTRDGRQKPDLVAPGVMVLAARSTPRRRARGTPSYIRMSGSSMAAPCVAGTIALMFGQSRRPLSIQETRLALLASCDPPPADADTGRLGSGFLNPLRALASLPLDTWAAGGVATGGCSHHCPERHRPFGGATKEEEVMTAKRTARQHSGNDTSVSERIEAHEPWEGLSPATLFDAFTSPGTVPPSPLLEAFAVVGRPHETLGRSLRPGDLLVTRARGIPFATVAVLTGPELRPHDRVRSGRSAIQPGYYAPVVQHQGRQDFPVCRVTDRRGVVPAHVLILRPRNRGSLHPPHVDFDAEFDPEVVPCVPGPEPDPTYRGPHPQIMRGSRRPSVGYAQQCLNNWMARYQSGTETCGSRQYAVSYVSDALRGLSAQRKLPLQVDCAFGANTERAVRAFQTCAGLQADGKIGPITWPPLVAYAPGATGTTYPPAYPPAYQPPPPPSPPYQPPPYQPPPYQPPPYQPPPYQPPPYQPPPYEQPSVYPPTPPPAYPPSAPPAYPPAEAETEEPAHDFAAEADVCVARPEADPTGRGTRPMIRRGSRRPAVGYAQQCLNNWMARFQAGADTCAGREFVTTSLAALAANRQLPLSVDCNFGSNTDRSARAFQTCKAVQVDGIIGPVTWGLLEAYAPGAIPVPPLPVPPVPVPPIPPLPTPPTPVPPTPVPPTPPALFERRDVWALSAQDPWHPTILWYARAVAGMQARDGTNFADPTSWRHLAETHGASIVQSNWPRGAQWNQCQHASWFFLPWHRMYLHHFEKIVRDTIVRLGGPRDWAVPYWDYSDQSGSDARRLPPAFRERNLPGGGGRNPLFVDERAPNMNMGGQLDPSDVPTAGALRETGFSDTGPATGFGGPPTGFNHQGGLIGRLERVPHGSVHVGVGGLNGWMSAFETAARDPIFWLHHANIDRLWEVWLRQPGRRNPTDRRWLEQRFAFGITGTPSATALAVREILNPALPPLRYIYADLPTTRPTEVEEQLVPAPLLELDEADRGGRVPPELVGATSGPVPLGPTPSVTHIAVTQPTGPQRIPDSEAEPGAGPRVVLKLDNVTATRLSAVSYDVYLNVPEGGNPAAFQDRRVGRVPMFGVIEASRRDDQHSGSGVSFSFDITPIVRRLESAGMWDPQRLRVNFVPVDGGQVQEGDVTVGRVSLFYQ
jgi:peptidoglycan hydrolase-like protein with peptidoglycan-binding domain/subtilisin family serine protease